MKQIKKETKRTFAYALCAAACLCILTLGIHLTMAAFTASSFLKAVATTNQTDSLFASDTLTGYTSAPKEAEGSGAGDLDKARQTLILSAAQDDFTSFSFNVRNCLKDNRNVVNPKDVSYVLSVEVQGDGLSDLSNYSISVNNEGATAFSGNIFTFGSRTLRGNNPTTDTFTVRLPAGDIGKVSFVIKAIASGSGTNLWGLAAKLVSSQAASVESSSVSGNLVLHTGTSATNDAYNYQITVTGKEANVTLTWPGDKVEIEPFFKEKYGVDPGENNTVTFTLKPGVTTINFYQLNGHTDVSNNDFTCK